MSLSKYSTVLVYQAQQVTDRTFPDIVLLLKDLLRAARYDVLTKVMYLNFRSEDLQEGLNRLDSVGLLRHNLGVFDTDLSDIEPNYSPTGESTQVQQERERHLKLLRTQEKPH